MPSRDSLQRLGLVVLGGAAVLCFWWSNRSDVVLPPSKSASPIPVQDAMEERVSTPESRREDRQALAEGKLQRKLKEALARKDARPGELLLGFKNAGAFQRFLERGLGSGVSVLGRADRFNLARVRVDDLDAFEAELENYGDSDYADLGANVLVFPPTVPTQDERTAATQVPLGNGLLDFLGVSGDTSAWGRGVTIAVLDSGVAADVTFPQGKLRYFDVGAGTFPLAEDGHGTGVAALVAGNSPDAFGVAPGADILSIRVTGADGLSDSYTLSQAIVAAADAGARIINISLGSYSTSMAMSSAVEYAQSLGAMIVASAGNDQATQLTWPAAYPGVISVGAVDATGRQVIFSNSGDGLSITAPGYGVETAWTAGQRVEADGTSFSAPIVSGSLAALMTLYPGITATRAWEILQQTTSDGGPAGPDPDYGAGTVNLAWAQHLNDPKWYDTAISSHYVNPLTGNLDVVVQNRGGTGVNGLKLEMEVNGKNQDFQIPWLPSGGLYVASVPINTQLLSETGKIEFSSILDNPSGFDDAVPKNNRKATSISIPKEK